MKPFKIKVKSEEHSKEIQEWLFSKGVHWWPKHLSCVLEGCKELYYGAIGDYISGSTGDSEYFEEQPLPEKWFYDGRLQDSPKPKDKANTFRELMQAQLSGEVLQVKVSDTDWEDCIHTLSQVRTEDIDKVVKGVRIKPKPRTCNGVELDECIKEPLRGGERYYLASILSPKYSSPLTWGGYEHEIRFLDIGIAYLKEESAIKHAKAMLNILD